MFNSQQMALAIRTFLLIIFIAAGAALLRFTFLGPFRFVFSVTSPVNAESLIAISFILLLTIGLSFGKQGSMPETPAVGHIVPCLAIIGLTALLFSTTLHAPLLFDAYTDVALAAQESLAKTIGKFYKHPYEGDFFFRPLVVLSYWIDFRWAGFDPFRWNLWNLGMHILTSLLVYLFARQLSLSPLLATLSGLIFAVHGSRPEVVSWVGERFDLLAAFFVMLSLVALIVSWDSTHNRKGWYALSIASFILALFSKESAYCFPLLVVGLIPFLPHIPRRVILRSALHFLLTAALVFLYRYWVLQSIGGYKTGGGDATILRFSAIRSIRALFFREWAFLFFPINWSADTGVWIKLSVAVFLAVLCGALLWCRPQRKYLSGSLFLAIAASLPVQHLLLLNQDLAGARVLYLPMLGVSLFWGFVLQQCKGRSTLILLATGLLVSQMIVLHHNLSIWREAAFLSQKTCRSLGEELKRTGDAAIVAGLPSIWHGIFFLRNGFSQCVAMNSGASADLVQVNDDTSSVPLHTRVFVWSPENNRLQEK